LHPFCLSLRICECAFIQVKRAAQIHTHQKNISCFGKFGPVSIWIILLLNRVRITLDITVKETFIVHYDDLLTL